MSGIRTGLLQWAVGRTAKNKGAADGDAGPIVLLQRADHLASLLAGDVATAASTVFVPGPAEPIDWAPDTSPGRRIVAYQGSVDEAGDELSLADEFFLQTQAYGVSEFLSVLGPTLVRITDDADFRAYLADADQARENGLFPAFLTNPVAHLADIGALGSGPTGDGPRTRLTVRPDGEISTSIGGAALARVGECSLADLTAAWTVGQETGGVPCAVSLAGVLDEPNRSAELGRRPWLGRYLAAVEALRITSTRGLDGIRVSGFGGPLAPAVRDLPPVADAGAPLVLWNADTAFLHDPRDRRTFALDLTTAAVLDVLITAGGVRAGRQFLPDDQLRQGEMLLARAGVAIRPAELAAVPR